MTLTFFATCSVLGSFVLAYYQWRKDKSEMAKGHTPIFIVSGILCLLSISAVWVQAFEEKANTQKRESAETELRNAGRKIFELNNQLQDSTRKLISLQTKVIELQDESINQITGGKPKIKLIVNTEFMQSNRYEHGKRFVRTNEKDLKQFLVTFIIHNQGDYNLKDVRFRIVDAYRDVYHLLSADGNGKFSSQLTANSLQLNTDSLFYNPDIEEQIFLRSKSLFTLVTHTKEEAYITRAPTGIGQYRYKVELEWSNGRMFYEVFLIEKGSRLKLERINVTKSGF